MKGRGTEKEKKRKWRGKGTEKEEEEEEKRNGKGKEEEGKRNGRGKEKERKRKGRGKKEERKSKEQEAASLIPEIKGRGTEKERKKKGKGEGQGKGKGKGKEKEKAKERAKKERTKKWKRSKGSLCGLGLLFEQMGIAKVSLISPLACMQLCTKQLQMWTLCTIIGIAFGGPYRYTVFGALSRYKRTFLYISSIPKLWPYLIWYFMIC